MGKMKDLTIPEYDQHSHEPMCSCGSAVCESFPDAEQSAYNKDGAQ